MCCWPILSVKQITPQHDIKPYCGALGYVAQQEAVQTFSYSDKHIRYLLYQTVALPTVCLYPNRCFVRIHCSSLLAATVLLHR